MLQSVGDYTMPIPGFRRDLMWWLVGMVLTCAGFSWLIGSMVNDLHPEDTTLYVFFCIASVAVPSSGSLGVSYMLHRFVPKTRALPFWLLYAIAWPLVVSAIVLMAKLSNPGPHGASGANGAILILLFNLPPPLFVGLRYLIADWKAPMLRSDKILQ